MDWRYLSRSAGWRNSSAVDTRIRIRVCRAQNPVALITLFFVILVGINLVARCSLSSINVMVNSTWIHQNFCNRPLFAINLLLKSFSSNSFDCKNVLLWKSKICDDIPRLSELWVGLKSYYRLGVILLNQALTASVLCAKLWWHNNVPLLRKCSLYLFQSDCLYEHIRWGEAFVVVYSVCDAKSFREAQDLLTLIARLKLPSYYTALLLGNQRDLDHIRYRTEFHSRKSRPWGLLFLWWVLNFHPRIIAGFKYYFILLSKKPPASGRVFWFKAKCILERVKCFGKFLKYFIKKIYLSLKA